jgi:C1A family cysteine protease
MNGKFAGKKRMKRRSFHLFCKRPMAARIESIIDKKHSPETGTGSKLYHQCFDNEIEDNFKGFPGYIPDEKDDRDYTSDHLRVKESISKMKLGRTEKIKTPEKVDLRKWCTKVKNQRGTNTCTAFAGVAMLEYYEKMYYGKEIDGSVLFLYKVTRNLMQKCDDTGANLRSTMKAMVLFGVPPEKYWPFDDDKINDEPPVFCYALAANYQAKKYMRLDADNLNKHFLLKKIKVFLYKKHPLIFGSSLYFLSFLHPSGEIAYLGDRFKPDGYHAMLAVGYDDRIEIRSEHSKHVSKGAILVRNSLGEEWGAKGYGWLPYDFILKGNARDWWCLLKNEWIDMDKFD